jgi:hypothetical protein
LSPGDLSFLNRPAAGSAGAAGPLRYFLSGRARWPQAQGEYEPARCAYQEGLALSQELKGRRGMAWCLECLAEVAVTEGQPERGARLMGAAEGLIEAIGASWPPTHAAGRERALAALRTALGEEAAAAALAESRARSLVSVIADALEQNPIASGGAGRRRA